MMKSDKIRARTETPKKIMVLLKQFHMFQI